MKLVFLGPPGAGKGTQAEKIAEKYNIAHASTGDIFRRAVSGRSELGENVKSYLDDGLLVPDELTAGVVAEMVLDRENDFVLDGFPRTIAQAQMLDKMLEDRSDSLDAVLYYQLDHEQAIERLTGRRVCSGCGANYHVSFMPPEKEGLCDRCGAELMTRSDSSLDVVEKRLQEYGLKTEPLVEYYSGQGLLRRVDASQDPHRVRKDTEQIIESF